MNPILPVYLHGIHTNTPKALVIEDTLQAPAWRQFAQMINDLKLESSLSFPPMIDRIIHLVQVNKFA